MRRLGCHNRFMCMVICFLFCVLLNGIKKGTNYAIKLWARTTLSSCARCYDCVSITYPALLVLANLRYTMVCKVLVGSQDMLLLHLFQIIDDYRLIAC